LRVPLVPGSLGRASNQEEWEALAVTALAAFVQERGAFVWPEAEAQLREQSWLTTMSIPTFPAGWGPDPHHLTAARQVMVGDGRLVKQTVELSGRRVSAWVDGVGLASRGRRTELTRLAASQRRYYRSFLGWTSRSEQCGDVAEGRVDASLRSLAGTYLWVPPSMQHGKVKALLGRPIQVALSMERVRGTAIRRTRRRGSFRSPRAWRASTTATRSACRSR
jgi:hypothetical protein